MTNLHWNLGKDYDSAEVEFENQYWVKRDRVRSQLLDLKQRQVKVSGNTTTKTYQP
jgi:hypothetical protein